MKRESGNGKGFREQHGINLRALQNGAYATTFGRNRDQSERYPGAGIMPLRGG